MFVYSRVVKLGSGGGVGVQFTSIIQIDLYHAGIQNNLNINRTIFCFEHINVLL